MQDNDRVYNESERRRQDSERIISFVAQVKTLEGLLEKQGYELVERSHTIKELQKENASLKFELNELKMKHSRLEGELGGLKETNKGFENLKVFVEGLKENVTTDSTKCLAHLGKKQGRIKRCLSKSGPFCKKTIPDPYNSANKLNIWLCPRHADVRDLRILYLALFNSVFTIIGFVKL